MIHRKENGELQAKAGLGIIDNILSTLSNHPISNRAVATEFGKVSADLTALENNDLDTYVNLDSYSSSNKYVAPSDGYLVLTSETGNLVSVYVYGSTSNVGFGVFARKATADYDSQTVFIKKGMKMFPNVLGSGSSARFYPLI